MTTTAPASSATDVVGKRIEELDTPTLYVDLDALEDLASSSSVLGDLIGHLRSHDLPHLEKEYVETFDHTRKCSLYLTYYAYGDTRRRGIALLQVKQAYRTAGVQWDDDSGELPDHLCAVLQFGATVEESVATQLLTEYRAGLEMLRIALAGWRRHDGTIGSPWHAAVQAVCATLPALAGDEADAVRRLIEQGPPAEEVGLGGYGSDPALSSRAGPALIAGSVLPVGSPTGDPSALAGGVRR